MSHPIYLCYLQSNTSRVSSHPTQPVVAQDSKHAYFQHQVSRNANRKQHVTNQNHQFCIFLKSDICELTTCSSSAHTCWWRRMCAQKVSCSLPSRLRGWTGRAAAGWWGTPPRGEPAGWPHSTRGSRWYYENFSGGSVGERERELDIVLFNITAGCSVIFQLWNDSLNAIYISHFSVSLLLLTMIALMWASMRVDTTTRSHQQSFRGFKIKQQEMLRWYCFLYIASMQPITANILKLRKL